MVRVIHYPGTDASISIAGTKETAPVIHWSDQMLHGDHVKIIDG